MYTIKRQALHDLLALASDKKAKVIYTAPMPTWTRLEDSLHHACIADEDPWFAPNRKSMCASRTEIPLDQYLTYWRGEIEYLRKIARNSKIFHLYQVHQGLCNVESGVCNSHEGAIRLYRDNGPHFSIWIAETSFYHSFESFLRRKALIPQS